MRIYQVSRFPASIKLLAAYWPKATFQWNRIENLFEFDFDNGVPALTLILICRLVPLYRIEFWSRPTHIQFFKLLTCKINKLFFWDRRQSWWIMELENYLTCVCLEKPYHCTDKILAPYTGKLSAHDSRQPWFGILCLIIPIVSQIFWCKCSSLLVIWLLAIEQMWQWIVSDW